MSYVYNREERIDLGPGIESRESKTQIYSNRI